MKLMRQLSACLLAVILLISAFPHAQAATSQVTYTGRADKFVFEPGSRYSPTDLFPNFRDLMPGDTVTQYITLRNKPYNHAKVKIYMRALGAHADSAAFLSQLHLTVAEVNDTVMFDAPASATAQLSDWTYLGTLYSGGEVDLAVILEVPVELDNRFQYNVGYLDWEFLVEELPIEASDPKTGDTIGYAVAVMVGSASALVILLLIYRKRKK